MNILSDSVRSDDIIKTNHIVARSGCAHNLDTLLCRHRVPPARCCYIGDVHVSLRRGLWVKTGRKAQQDILALLAKCTTHRKNSKQQASLAIRVSFVIKGSLHFLLWTRGSDWLIGCGFKKEMNTSLLPTCFLSCLPLLSIFSTSSPPAVGLLLHLPLLHPSPSIALHLSFHSFPPFLDLLFLFVSSFSSPCSPQPPATSSLPPPLRFHGKVATYGDGGMKREGEKVRV